MLTQQYLSFNVNFWWEYIFNMCQLRESTMIFHPNFSHPLTIFHHKLPATEGRVCMSPGATEEQAWFQVAANCKSHTRQIDGFIWWWWQIVGVILDWWCPSMLLCWGEGFGRWESKRGCGLERFMWQSCRKSELRCLGFERVSCESCTCIHGFFCYARSHTS